MVTELSKEWVEINEGEGGKMVIPRRVIELGASETKFRVYQYLFAKARHTAGWESYRQGSKKGQLYLREGELIASEREIGKFLHIHPSQIHSSVAFLGDHYFIERRIEQSVSIIIICNYKQLIKLKNDELSSDQNIPKTEAKQQPDGSYIISILSKALTNDVTNDVTKEKDISEPASPKQKTKKQPSLDPEVAEWFDKWWAIYPARNGVIKVGKQNAFDIFKREIRSEENFLLLLKATGRYGTSIEATYYKDPERFLKKGYWRDFIPKETERPKQGPARFKDSDGTIWQIQPDGTWEPVKD